ncbi:AAA ATPase domain protein [anaerobic digester metagenome]
MKLLKFRATNVHGYLNYKIDFHERLTFLIGINGTGKTSVLKLILGLISPSFNYINSIDFDEVELICNEPSKGQIVITAIKNSENNEVKLILKINEEDPLEGVFNRISQVQLNELDNDDSNEKMRFIIEAFDRHEVVQAIKSLTTPLFLGLDRRVYEGQQIDKMRQSFLFRRRYRHYPQNDPLNISLMEIQEVIYDYVRIIASEQPKINQDFKNKILLQSFQFLESQELNIVKDFRELKGKRKEAIDAFENLRITGFTEHINNFFDQLESTLRNLNEIQGKKKGDEIDIDNIHIFQKWFNNQPQLKRINELITYNLAYQKELDKLYEPIEKTKNIINSFFSESKKELLIEPQGELKVKFKNDKIANIYELSSGEKQIVTMLGHLIYFEEKYKNESGIFIIDEPEVSLHLAWQEIFVDSILTASPRTQFILATHSPAIIGDNSDSLFQDLADLN